MISQQPHTLRPFAFRLLLAVLAAGWGLVTPGASFAGNPQFARSSFDNTKIFWWLQITDTRIGAFNQQDTENLEWVALLAPTYFRPKFIVATGNLTSSTNGGLIVNGPWRVEWDDYRQPIDAASLGPDFWYDLPGTRDQYNDRGFTNYRNFSVRGEATGGETQHSWTLDFPYGKYHFVGVNTAPKDGLSWPWDNAGLTGPELDQVEAWLTRHQDARLTFAFGHHRVGELGDGRDRFRNLLRDYGVSVYGSGDTQDFASSFGDNTYFVECGSLSRSSDQHLVLYAVDSDVVSYTNVKIDEFPVILVTNPGDRDQAGGNGLAFDVAPDASSPLRVLIFDPLGVSGATYRLDGGASQPLTQVAAPHPAHPFLWEAQFTTKGVGTGTKTLRVDATGASGQRNKEIRIRVRPGACSNGSDDDGDSLVDYPNDPGCESPSDPSEVDNTPTPTNTPTMTPTQTATITPTPSKTPTPSNTATPIIIPSSTPTGTRTPLFTNTPTKTPTATPFIQLPKVALAGYWDTAVSSAGGEVFIYAVILDDRVKEAELAYAQTQLGFTLYDDSLHHDFGEKDFVFANRLPLAPGVPADAYLFEIEPMLANVRGFAWPYLVVTDY